MGFTPNKDIKRNAPESLKHGFRGQLLSVSLLLI